MDIHQQMLLAKQTRHTEEFHGIAALAGEIPVAGSDFDFALQCSAAELRMVAVVAHALLRTGKKDGRMSEPSQGIIAAPPT